MKGNFEVNWSDLAEKDILDIMEYIADDSPAAALKSFTEIRGRAAGLYRFPQRMSCCKDL